MLLVRVRLLKTCLLALADHSSVSCLLISICTRVIIRSRLSKGHHWAVKAIAVGTSSVAHHILAAIVDSMRHVLVLATLNRKWGVALTDSLLLVSGWQDCAFHPTRCFLPRPEGSHLRRVGSLSMLLSLLLNGHEVCVAKTRV